MYPWVKDAAGNVSTLFGSGVPVEVDSTSPNPPTVTLPPPYTADTAPLIGGTAEAESSVNVSYLDDLGTPVQICQDVQVDSQGDWSCIPSSNLPEREIQLTVTATDEAGNQSGDTSHSFSVDVTPPAVDSIVRADADHTRAASVRFTVTFSETVTGISTSAPYEDFQLTTGLTGASISAVTGSGTTYMVTVDRGVGNGTVRLDILDNDNIVDVVNNPLGGAGVGNGNHRSGEEYTITKTNGANTTGVFRPSNGLLYLKNSNTDGYADVGLHYGMGGDSPVVGDWDGDGTVTIGVYRHGIFYLRNENTPGYAEVAFPFGSPGDQPISGDWDGDGIDTIGVYRNSSGTFYLRNSNTLGPADAVFQLGMPGDVGIAGDWDGDGFDTTGVFRPSNGFLFLKNQNSTGYADVGLNYGIPGDLPVTGDWDSNGTDTIGVYRHGIFYLRNENTPGYANVAFALGVPGDLPIAGNWDGIP